MEHFEEEQKVRIVMNKYDKKQLKSNIVKFIIGLILLALSRWYIQWHPAERVSVFSWFEVLWQKIEIIWHNIFNWNGELVERKYDLEKYYKELLTMAEWNSCISVEDYKLLEDTYNSLKNEPKNTLNDTLPSYTKMAYEFEVIVNKDNCK